MIRLRPHHLLCMLTYAGEGYDAAFRANFDRLVRRLAQGEPIAVVEGPDDICAPRLCHADHHCNGESIGERDRLAAGALAELLAKPIRSGQLAELTPTTLKQMRDAFARGEIRAACEGCEWSQLCTSIADGGYAATKLGRELQSPLEDSK